MGNEMKTTERVEQAFKRIKELLTLVSDWTKKSEKEDLLTKEFREKKLKMIEDLYKTTDRLNKHIENMALNKVNIEFLQKQMDKVLVDIEKLKDADRDISYKNGHSQ